MAIAAGIRVGPYEIGAPLGAGGMGEVFRARDLTLGREVAIKFLSDHLSASSSHIARFEQEARSASALNHPNIITIYSFGKYESTHYLAMELVEGKSLRALLQDGIPPIRRTLQIAAQIAEGLAAAHERGIVHRDLKPENVMITRDGFVKILDFGLAKLVPEVLAEDEDTLEFKRHETGPGTVLGTVGYMSPEQASGKIADYRADQFSFGAIVYEMATGRRAFKRGTAVDTLSAILHDDPEDISRLNPKAPAPLRWIVDRCLAKDPASRYASTSDLARELETLRDRISETPPVTGEAALPPVVANEKKRLGSAFAVAAVVGAAAVGAWSMEQRGRSASALPDQKYLAVMPFRDLSGTPSGQLFSEGLGESLTARLASGSDVQLMPAAASITDSSDLRKIARELGANLILRGAVQRSGQHLRVTYTVLVADGGRQIAGDTISGYDDNIFDIQDQLAGSVMRNLHIPARGNFSSSRNSLPSALAADHYLEALGHLRRTENPASVDAAIRILESLGDSPTVLSTLARAYHARFIGTADRQWALRALETADKAWKSDPDSFDALVTRGQTSLLLGELDSAEKAFETVLARNPSSFDAVMGLGRTRKAQGKLADAERLIRRGVALQPENWSAHNTLATFCLTYGRFPEAVQGFERALSLTPDNVPVLNNLGVTYQQMGRDAKAIETYQRSIAVRPNADALSNLGTVQFSKGDYSDSVLSFQRAAALNPEAAVLWMNLGDACRWSKNCGARGAEAFARAIEILTADLTVRPNDASTHSWLALCSVKTGRRADAVAHALRSVALAPADPYIAYQAAVVFEIAGEREKALESLAAAVKKGYPKVAVEADPELADLRKSIEFAALRSS